MQMSVFRQGHPTEQLEHLDCMRQAVGSESANMIMHAMLHNLTVLVVLPSGQAVIKPHEETDEAMSFEDLYDSAISPFEYRKIEKQNVRTREELALHLYEMDLFLVQERPVFVRIQLKARSEHDVKAMWKRLVREDTKFGTELQSRYASAMMDATHGAIETSGPLKTVEAAPEDAPEWEFLDPS